MLALIVAYRDLCRVVSKDVSGHKDWIVEEPNADALLPLPLVFELRHTSQFPIGSDAVKNPGELSVGAYMALNE
ncbi:unannotated protein [freshwater metagenome]|uniref:Unannotated protein n=1 Tax=freshwater metagenome TaxID=449393 RepID=A0A6J7NWT9_9ZZZZ